jgi:hypothetical protein
VVPVKRVTMFYWLNDTFFSFGEDPFDREVDAAAIATVGANLPRLEMIHWGLRDREFREIKPRYQQRQGKLSPAMRFLEIFFNSF